MSAAWEVAQTVFAIVGILTTVCFLTFIFIVVFDKPEDSGVRDGVRDVAGNPRPDIDAAIEQALRVVEDR